jgi:hypothetical protein
LFYIFRVLKAEGITKLGQQALQEQIVSIVTGYGLGDRGSVPGRDRTGSEVHLASYAMGTEGSFLG